MIHNEQHQVSGRGLLLGTCRTLSQESGIATPIIRIAAVIALCVWFKLAVLAYCAGAVYFRMKR